MSVRESRIPNRAAQRVAEPEEGGAEVSDDGRLKVSKAARAMFRDPESGYHNLYAHRAHNRALADAYYLFRWKAMGHQAAAEATCERYGHEPRGGICERCGAAGAAMRAERIV